jgi:phosphohistidine phosphatase SixA
VYLIRHACAGDKRHWTGPDVERPLDAAGIAQAEALADELAVLPIHRESTV